MSRSMITVQGFLRTKKVSNGGYKLFSVPITVAFWQGYTHFHPQARLKKKDLLKLKTSTNKHYSLTFFSAVCYVGCMSHYRLAP